MLTIIKPDFEFTDERGTLTQLVRQGYSQFNVITSKAGVERGNHYHKLNKEAFFIISGKLQIDVCGTEGITSHIFSAGDFFGIDPYDLHSFYFLEDTILVSMYDRGVELTDGTKDIYIRNEGI